MSAVLCKPFIIVWSVTLASGRLPIAPQVCQRLLAVELAPVMLQTFQDPFAPSPAMGLATPASQQVTSLQHNSCFCVQKADMLQKLFITQLSYSLYFGMHMH